MIGYVEHGLLLYRQFGFEDMQHDPNGGMLVRIANLKQSGF